MWKICFPRNFVEVKKPRVKSTSRKELYVKLHDQDTPTP